jgi:hypothetical protein
MKLLPNKIYRIFSDIIAIIVIIFIFPATFVSFLLHENFKQEAYIDNRASKLQKIITNQKIWVIIGVLVDIFKLILIIYF